jgi:signal transduction histidine kinase
MYTLNVYLENKLLLAEVPISGQVTIGRDAANTIVLSDNSVSRFHVALEVRQEGRRNVVTLKDAGSTNGTFVNEEQIEEKQVTGADVIRIGRCRLEIKESLAALFPDIRDDDEQTIVFKGDPFSDQTMPAERLRALYDLTLGHSEIEIPSLLEQAAGVLQRCLEFDSFCCLLEGRAGLVACTCWDREGPCELDQITLSRTIVKSCLDTGQPVLSENVQGDSRFHGAESLALKDVVSAICAPLRDESGNFGVLYCSLRDPLRRFDSDDLQFLMLVASRVAVGIVHKRVLSQVRLEAAKLEAILASLMEGVIVCDRTFRILSANAAAREIFRRRALVGLQLDEALGGFTHTFDPITAPLIKSFEVEREITGVFSYKFQGIQTYHATVSSVSGGLELDGWRHIICLRDVTQKRRSEKMRSVFVNQLAHKLRTPLTVVSGVGFLLAEQLDKQGNEELSSLISMSNEGCRQLSALIDRFEEFTRLNLRDSLNQAQQVVTPLSSILAQALETAGSEIDLRDLKVDNSIEREDYNVAVNVDGLVRCFVHLIENARKFAGESASLTIKALIEADCLRIQFIDDGPGIPPTELEAVFGMFHQVDPEDTGEVPGVGLGLWYAREVIQAHGGDIRIESPAAEHGKGTQIEIILPRRLVVEEAAEDLEEDCLIRG